MGHNKCRVFWLKTGSQFIHEVDLYLSIYGNLFSQKMQINTIAKELD